MRITVISTFLDGPERFEAGDTRTVSDDRGAAFIAHGWASADGTPAATTTAAATGGVTLDIHNGQLGLGDSNG